MKVPPNTSVNLLSGDEMTQPNRKVWGFVIHTAVDAPGPTNLPAYFDRYDVKAESTFWLPNSGHAVQMMPMEKRVDTQGSGNMWYQSGHGYVGYASVETEDDRRPEQQPWNAAQLEWLIDTIVWIHEEYDIPLRIMQHPKDQGFGWHSMWGYTDPFDMRGSRVSYNPWTSAQGKTCPGQTRVNQIRDIIWPAVQARAAEDVMTPAQEKKLDQAIQIGLANAKVIGEVQEKLVEHHRYLARFKKGEITRDKWVLEGLGELGADTDAILAELEEMQND